MRPIDDYKRRRSTATPESKRFMYIHFMKIHHRVASIVRFLLPVIKIKLFMLIRPMGVFMRASLPHIRRVWMCVCLCVYVLRAYLLFHKFDRTMSIGCGNIYIFFGSSNITLNVSQFMTTTPHNLASNSIIYRFIYCPICVFFPSNLPVVFQYYAYICIISIYEHIYSIHIYGVC